MATNSVLRVQPSRPNQALQTAERRAGGTERGIYEMKVELSRFRVKPGKSDRVNEWLTMLNSRMKEVVQTLDREQMKLEIIFREIIEGDEYLYWFSVQGEQGEHSGTSPFEVDAKHIEFHKECIDHEYGCRDAQPQVVMVPENVAEAMTWTNPMESTTSFERREIIHRREQRGSTS